MLLIDAEPLDDIDELSHADVLMRAVSEAETLLDGETLTVVEVHADTDADAH